MEKFEVIVTDDYDRLVPFFIENELEFDAEDEVDTDIVRSYKIENENGALIGGAVLAKRENEYIIDGIAVAPDYRSERLGEKLLKRLLHDAKALGGKSVFLVARAPGFFRKNGFAEVDPDDAPNFFECRYCPQYRVSCSPEVMKLEI